MAHSHETNQTRQDNKDNQASLMQYNKRIFSLVICFYFLIYGR